MALISLISKRKALAHVATPCIDIPSMFAANALVRGTTPDYLFPTGVTWRQVT
jgi:hypothetical protein